MRQSYLLIYSPSLGTRDEVKVWLDEMPQIISWRYDIPYSFFVISEASAEVIARAIKELAKDKANPRFLVVKIPDTKKDTASVFGWLTRDTWNFIGDKEFKEKQASATGQPKSD